MTVNNKPILTLRNIRKSFGPTEVLHGVDLEVYPGEVVAFLGENGAGKSTTSNIIAGGFHQTSGEMTWLGEPYAPNSPREAINQGLVLIHQELRLLEHLSVAENVFIGRWPGAGGIISRKKMEEEAQLQIDKLGLTVSPSSLVRGLSTANQQLIEIAKALALNAKLLILDEPTAALGGAETELLFQQIERLKAEGVGIIYISHRLEEIRKVADRIVVMRDGDCVKQFDSADIPVKTLVESMVGRDLDRMFPAIPTPSEEISLEVKQLSSPSGRFSDINFAVKKGEIFGIAGLIGAGRTEVVRAITGADPIASGKVILDGVEITPKTPTRSIESGVVLVPEDRKLQGLVLDHSIEDNIAYANLSTISQLGVLNPRRIKKYAKDGIARFGVKGTGTQNAGEMSGGNQQKVILAKWLAKDPKVVVLDEPTRGIDVGARSAIYEIIVELAQKGIAVIVVSSDLEEVLGISNRIMVMAEGKMTGILNREDANDVSVMELATAFG
ncbi:MULTISPECIES: sugar ABC transporter ATP-binding protein [Marinomonas]|uniref:Monosaccharide ABC transporter ATP-binding protein (CUT2 family) n=1 Tax=Marinomonas balearica TaxID=491947 RepID=A0A4R6MES2_9GAMM|nr:MULTISPECIES: sugar ABC transporter ATP-binding protein [Marinomonas]TDO99765.1 monosaccharide ABC transporter ATP-binding protein (CUT2 family) [Marinomonas balearica]WCN12956.1 ATP-binding cassette domain-containing protein [Marinomonas mediterranea]